MKDWNPKLWLRILLPTVLVVVWFVIAGLGGPTFGKISEVSTNDQAGFLPASAQSTEVNQWQSKFNDSENIPAIVLFNKQSGEITDAEKTEFEDLTQVFIDAEGVAPTVEGEAPSVLGPIYSEDNKAVEYLVFFDANGEELNVSITDLRTGLADVTPAGFDSYVTGPGGLLADFVAGFAGIDGILLIVALLAVFIILLVVYRALLLPILVLLTSVFALSGSILGIYYLALNDLIKVSGQSQGILSILVIGAATDYALLFVARYREALFEVQNKWTAIGRAFRGSFEPIFASAATVIAALLCLLFSDLNSNKSLGPIAAFGIGFAFLAAITFLPALLAIFGRAAFWPFMPKPGKKKLAPVDANTLPGLEGVRGLWKGIGNLVGKRPRTTWIVTLLLLLAAIAGLPGLKASGIPQTEFLLGDNIESVDGQEVLAEHFDAGDGSPIIIIADEANYAAVITAAEGTQGITKVTVQPDAEAMAAAYTAAIEKAAEEAAAAMAAAGAAGGMTGPPSGAMAGDAAAFELPEIDTIAQVVDGKVLINATLEYQADSSAAEDVVKGMRIDLISVDPSVLVGGETAIALDTNQTAQADLVKIIPLVLAVIFIILMLLLRSIIAPLILIGTVVVSFAATMGLAAIFFNNVFGFPGADASVPLFGFVFLVALGIDYNIFLMTRVREESINMGTRPGILKGLTVTGGVITSAGVVLAATFAALGVIPLLFLVQLAFIVSVGVIIDTVLVRTLLVPALAYDIGPKIWWPSKLGRIQK
ncbi:RND superfamily putative drug exporter [Aurantimicrobium minutum]|uniref:MMPL family transporter n=1 Tax=Aurantimicrobium minutum TaxID=708131 RepID=UPI002476C1AA|nr:MMPL family transporter [Aurantimicrobium minutum]MDH6531867.1 RND superfamily putative drug exporter [Aurantimicrobium minutum]